MNTANNAFEPDKPRARRRSEGNLWWILVLHATWIILLLIGIWHGFTSLQFTSKGEEVPGTVIALDESSSADSGTTYSPVFEYQVDGKTYTYESANASNPPTHRVGEQTTLLVDPDHPEKAREKSFSELWLVPVIMCPVSGIVAVVAFVLPLFIKPRKK